MNNISYLDMLMLRDTPLFKVLRRGKVLGSKPIGWVCNISIKKRKKKKKAKGLHQPLYLYVIHENGKKMCN